MIKIIKADWNGLDVTDKVYEYFVNGDEIHLSASNHYFTDPQMGVEKKLILHIENDGVVEEFVVNEGANFHYPVIKYKNYNSLIVTSCNRVEQVCLALSVNSRIIKNWFNLVVVDCSTDYMNTKDAVKMHSGDDPYNLINQNNYNSDWTLFEKHIKTLPNISEYKVIHVTPRLSKQVGEATLMGLGAMQSSFMGSKYGLKLTGVCNLKEDWVTNLSNLVLDNDFTYVKRTGYSQPSTRVLPLRNDKFGSMISDAGFSQWIDDYDFIERRLETLGNKNKMNKFDGDERDFIVDEGVGRSDHREIITKNLEKHNLLDCDDYYIQKFIKGKIW
jgi:hypothetical protein